MRTHAAERTGLGGAAKEVAEHASAIAKLELELAGLEIKRKVGSLGSGIGLGVAAATFAWFGIAFLLATAAAALAVVLATWLALLVVAASLLFLAIVTGLLARSRIRKGTPPVPEQAIEEAKLTSAALRGDGRP